MLQHMKKVYTHVEHILAVYPETRDDDRLLILKFIELNTSLKSILGESKWEVLKTVFLWVPSFETIRRARQKIQASGKYIGHKQSERQALGEEMRLSERRDIQKKASPIYLFERRDEPCDEPKQLTL